MGNWLMRGWIVKKILGVVGSPCRNVNTHILVSRILEGAKKEVAALEVILLNNLTIAECDVCHLCR